MATNYYTIKAKVKWAKLYEPDEYAGAKKWVLNAYPVDGKEWEKIQKSGFQGNPKDDADGKFITLRRPTQKVIGENLVVFCPPEITGAVNVSYVDKDGNKVRSYNKGENSVTRQGDPTPIDNGSLCLINFCVYDTKQGKGSRLENITVLDLVSREDKPEVKVKEEDTGDSEVEVSKEDEGDDIPW